MDTGIRGLELHTTLGGGRRYAPRGWPQFQVARSSRQGVLADMGEIPRPKGSG